MGSASSAQRAPEPKATPPPPAPPPPPYRKKDLLKDPRTPWKYHPIDGTPLSGTLRFDSFTSAQTLFSAYLEKNAGRSTRVCPGELSLSIVEGKFPYEPSFFLKTSMGEKFDPRNPSYARDKRPLDWIEKYVVQSPARFVFMYIMLSQYSSQANVLIDKCVAHATGILFDLKKKQAYAMDPLNFGDYDEKRIRKYRDDHQRQCDFLQERLTAHGPAFKEWSFMSIAPEFSVALRYMERTRPEEANAGYCCPILYYHVITMIKYLPLLDDIMAEYPRDEFGTREEKERYVDRLRRSAISTMIVHFMCDKNISSYPPPPELVHTLFGFETDPQTIFSSADAKAKREAAVKFRTDMFKALETQQDTASLYNQVCENEWRAWTNLMGFCQTVLVQYFSGALANAGCAPLYLWRVGKRPKGTRREDDGLYYLDDDGHPVYIELFAREREARAWQIKRQIDGQYVPFQNKQDWKRRRFWEEPHKKEPPWKLGEFD